ncbi:MAG: lysophospholipid acyltransferase family protein [Spirochaetia bacterium]|nr:lysophospholipid acyltransferase family protein [Spirochaetia bacterium]
MTSKRKIAKYIEYIFIRILLGILGMIPFHIRSIILENFMLFVSKLLKKNALIIQNNIRCAFPEKNEEWVNSIYLKNLKGLGKFAAEFLEIPKMKKQKYKNKIVCSPSRNKIIEYLSDGGLVVLGHMGNWEMHGSLFSQWLPPEKLYAITSRQSNPWVDKYIEKVRNAGGARSVFTDGSSIRYLKLLKGKKVLCFLADQNAGKNGKFFQFLNRPASTHLGPAVFARVSGVKTFFAYSTREKGKIHAYFEVMEKPSINPEKYPEKWDIEFTKIWLRKLEEAIKEHPEEYFWAHNRWKAIPLATDKIFI